MKQYIYILYEYCISLAIESFQLFVYFLFLLYVYCINMFFRPTLHDLLPAWKHSLNNSCCFAGSAIPFLRPTIFTQKSLNSYLLFCSRLDFILTSGDSMSKTAKSLHIQVCLPFMFVFFLYDKCARFEYGWPANAPHVRRPLIRLSVTLASRWWTRSVSRSEAVDWKTTNLISYSSILLFLLFVSHGLVGKKTKAVQCHHQSLARNF